MRSPGPQADVDTANAVPVVSCMSVSMTAKILQVVNSVFFGLPQKISNPQQAVILLGLEAIKALVLTIKIFSEFSRI